MTSNLGLVQARGIKKIEPPPAPWLHDWTESRRICLKTMILVSRDRFLSIYIEESSPGTRSTTTVHSILATMAHFMDVGFCFSAYLPQLIETRGAMSDVCEHVTVMGMYEVRG